MSLILHLHQTSTKKNPKKSDPYKQHTCFYMSPMEHNGAYHCGAK
jgi:hypothetical protein